MSRKKRKLNSKEQETRAANQNIELIQEDEIVEEQETMEQQERQELIEEQEPVQDAPAQQLGIISTDTMVTGDIFTDGHLLIDGIVEGDVFAKGDIKVTGKIKGRVCCLNIESFGQIQADEIEVKDTVILGEGMTIKGDVICRDAVISGRVDGNLCVSGNLSLSKSAVITGDIKTSSMSAEMGAKINGNIMIER